MVKPQLSSRRPHLGLVRLLAGASMAVATLPLLALTAEAPTVQKPFSPTSLALVQTDVSAGVQPNDWSLEVTPNGLVRRDSSPSASTATPEQAIGLSALYHRYSNSGTYGA